MQVVSQTAYDAGSLEVMTLSQGIKRQLDAQDRHREFLSPNKTSTSFRPKKRHRVAVFKLLRMLDNQACPPLSLVVLCGPIDQAVMVG